MTLRLAIACSYLNQYGGAERVLEVVHEMYPEAPILTSIYWPEALPDAYRSWDIRPSFLNRLPSANRHHQPLLPLYPLAFERFDVRRYDVLLSITSAFAHGIITPPDTRHICYCLTPARFLWDYDSYVAREGLGRVARVLLPPVVRTLRAWDRRAASRVDEFVAISQAVRARIRQHYQRDAKIIYPPVNVDRFYAAPQRADYYLSAGRLIPYKRVDLVVQAFNELGLPLHIVGDGRDRAALQAMARPNIVFRGRLSDADLQEEFAHCRAFIFPGEEDFGIAPVEAQAAGSPVIAYAGGGALDTVVDGVTGVFFREKNAASLIDAVQRFDQVRFDSAVIQSHAQRFGTEPFMRQLAACVAAPLPRREGGPTWS